MRSELSKIGQGELYQHFRCVREHGDVYLRALGLVATALSLDCWELQRNRPQDKKAASMKWLEYANARRLAQYLLHVALGIPQADVGYVSGVSRQAILLALEAVEERRDTDHDFDETVTALEKMICGDLADAQ